MKRILLLISVIIIAVISLGIKTAAAEIDIFDNELRQLEDSIPDDTSNGLKDLGINGINDVSQGTDISKLFNYAADTLLGYSKGPMSSMMILICIVLIASIAESYTYSLRYTHTKDIMNIAVSLMTVSTIITPIAELSSDTVAVIKGSSSIMLIYLPVMAGIMAFSGHMIASAGYYTAVVTAAGFLSKISSAVLAPLLNIFLSLAVCSGINGRIKLGGIIEIAAKWFKWILTFAVSMFAAVVGMNAALSGAGDSLTARASKFALSSFIPLIGPSVAEAYQTLQSSLSLLRSGMGVFVIISIIVSFLPVMARILLWSLTVGVSKLIAEAFSVTSANQIFTAISSFLSALRAVIIGVLIAFVISTAVMIHIGGSS